MIAIEITKSGGPEVLKPVEWAVPEPGPAEVLVRVEAAGVNRPDILQRLGQYPAPTGASSIPGLEIAGVVERADDHGQWKVGDHVCALVSGGGYAEYCAVPAVQCLPIPEEVGAIAAAAIPETYFTVWANLFQSGGLKSSERLLVHGGTSGIGSTAVQLANAFGATVFATCGSEKKCKTCEEIGAKRAINYREQDFVTEIREETNGGGVDVILDIIGGEYLPRNLKCLGLHGRLVQVGLMGGYKGELHFMRLLQNRLTITGSTLRSRTPEEKGAIARELKTNVWPLLQRGEVAPLIYATFPLMEAAEAHRLLESGEVVGKVVLQVSSAGRK